MLVLGQWVTAQLDPAFLHLPAKADSRVLVERWTGNENLIPTKEVMLLLGLVRSSVTVVSAQSLPGGSVPPGVTSSCCSKPGRPWEGRSWQASPAQGSGAQGCLLLASTHSPGGIPSCCLDSSCHSGMTPTGPERGQPHCEGKATPGSLGACGLSKIVVVPLPAWN